jgi:Mg-chelatase subunit ChlD
MKTPLLVSALFVLTAGVVIGYPQLNRPALVPPPQLPATQPASTSAPRIEAVFVLDTTGSMSGLIQAAKENIWSIASSMAQAQPTPELAIGLVAFRDRGDAYVTRVIDLSTDLDSVYAQLMDFEADGGGDHPEAVNQALLEAVERIGWSRQGGAYRTIFLVGDAPPQQYPDEPGQPEIAARARARGIVINTIQAGSDGSTRSSWMQLAELAGGAYFQVGQAGSAVAVATPYDESIARLSRELDGTRLFYGDAPTRQALAAKEAAADKLHRVASPAAQAKRASFNASAAGRTNLLGDSELVDAVASGKVALAEVDIAHLPAPLAALSPAERVVKVEETASRRRELSAEIAELTRQRQTHIEATLADDDRRADSLDYRLFETVKAQAAEKGLSYGAAEPVH